MAEYIDREALIEWLKRIPLIDLSDGHGFCRVIMEHDFKKAINKMPKGIIADVAPVRHGRWGKAQDMRRMDGNIYDFRCSRCNAFAEKGLYNNYDRLTNYCPNCGAKMDLEVS